MAIAPIHFNVAITGDAPVGAPVHFNVALAGAVAGGGGAGLPGLTVTSALSAMNSSTTGTTTQTTLATVALPAIAPGQVVRITIPVISSVATAKLYRVMVAGVTIVSWSTSTVSGRIIIDIYNTANGVQAVDQSLLGTSTISTSTAAAAMVLQAPSSMVISVTPGTTAETDGISGYSVEILSL